MSDVTLKLKGMNKPQQFTIYPIQKEDTRILLQSDHRFAIIDPETGKGRLSKHVANYPTIYHCADRFGGYEIALTPDQLLEVKLTAMGEGSAMDVSGVMTADNSGISNLKF